MRTRSQVFNGEDAVKVPGGSLYMHSTADEHPKELVRSPRILCLRKWAWETHRLTSRYRYSYERHSDCAMKMWQNYQFSYHHIISPNRSTGKLRHKQRVHEIAVHNRGVGADLSASSSYTHKQISTGYLIDHSLEHLALHALLAFQA